MTLPAPTYDLVLLLDPQADDATRAKLLADARTAIKSEGELLRDDDWGDRALAYPIDRKATAEYHLLQFHASSPELLNGLDRSLRIADEVLRFRIVKLAPGVPEAPDMSPSSSPTRRPEGEAEPQASAQPQAEQPEPVAPAPAEPGADLEPPPAGEPQPEMALGEPS
jgi:small subunit ribosomal protein S6